jgi:proline iminopeptidase
VVNGVALFVDDRGDPAAPPLLFIHGGPGQSCWDFMAAQGDRLARSIRVIGVDQRGVLRSGDIPPSEPLDVDVLVDDFEALREHLGIERWTVLGHSAGGIYALRYATRHPDSVSAVVFDCPCWDCDLTDRHRLPVVAARLEERGKREAATAVRRLAEKRERITAADESWVLMQHLGDAYLDLFFSRSESARAYEAFTTSAGFSDEDWAHGLSHLPLLADLYEPQLHRLAELAVPSLLVHGIDDLVLRPTWSRSTAGGSRRARCTRSRRADTSLSTRTPTPTRTS